jgi:DnaJ-class molecular chaperone
MTAPETAHVKRCSSCNGRGDVKPLRLNTYMILAGYYRRPCPKCGGTGFIKEDKP